MKYIALLQAFLTILPHVVANITEDALQVLFPRATYILPDGSFNNYTLIDSAIKSKYGSSLPGRLDPRGEYESKSEYEARKRAHQNAINRASTPLDGETILYYSPVLLKYDADNEQFQFKLSDIIVSRTFRISHSAFPGKWDCIGWHRKDAAYVYYLDSQNKIPQMIDMKRFVPSDFLEDMIHVFKVAENEGAVSRIFKRYEYNSGFVNLAVRNVNDFPYRYSSEIEFELEAQKPKNIKKVTKLGIIGTIKSDGGMSNIMPHCDGLDLIYTMRVPIESARVIKSKESQLYAVVLMKIIRTKYKPYVAELIKWGVVDTLESKKYFVLGD